MEKYTYTAEEVKVIGEQIQEKGIQKGSNKEMELSLCLKYGAPKEKMDCVIQLIDTLSDTQTMDICSCILVGVDFKNIKRMCENPQEIETYKKAYFDSVYGPKHQEIYKEVFDEFHVQWKTNFDQLLRQTDMLSNFLDFMREQFDKKEQELECYRKIVKKAEDIPLSYSNTPLEFNEEEDRWPNKKGKKSDAKRNEDVESVSEAESERKTSGKVLMERVKKRLVKQLDPERYLLKLFARLTEEQMGEALDGYERGLSIQDIKKYAKKEYNPRQMHEMKKLILKKYNSNSILK